MEEGKGEEEGDIFRPNYNSEVKAMWLETVNGSDSMTNKPIKNAFYNGIDRKLGNYLSQIKMKCINLRSNFV